LFVWKVSNRARRIFRTNLHREENEPASARFTTKFLAPIFYGLIGISTEQAAQSSIFLATQVNTSGGFFHGMFPRDVPSPLATPELEELLWKKSLEVTKTKE
jgi:hypothetical protein